MSISKLVGAICLIAVLIGIGTAMPETIHAGNETIHAGNYSVAFNLTNEHRTDNLTVSQDNHTVVGVSLNTFDGKILIVNYYGKIVDDLSTAMYLGPIPTGDGKWYGLWAVPVEGSSTPRYVCYIGNIRVMSELDVISTIVLINTIKIIESKPVTYKRGV